MLKAVYYVLGYLLKRFQPYVITFSESLAGVRCSLIASLKTYFWQSKTIVFCNQKTDRKRIMRLFFP